MFQNSLTAYDRCIHYATDDDQGENQPINEPTGVSGGIL